jgi:hypothetical protein
VGGDEGLLNVLDVTVMPTLVFDFGNTILASGEMLAVEMVTTARTNAWTPYEGGKLEVDETYGAAAKKDVNPTVVAQRISRCRSSDGRNEVKHTSSATSWPFHSLQARSCLPSRRYAL